MTMNTKISQKEEKYLKEEKEEEKDEMSFCTFCALLMGLIFPYVGVSVLLKTANLFLWEAEWRFYLLILSPVSAIIFGLIEENLPSVKIFLKRFLYHFTLLLVGMYLLCSFIEAEMNISKWKVVFSNERSTFIRDIIPFLLLILVFVILSYIIAIDIEYVYKRKEKNN